MECSIQLGYRLVTRIKILINIHCAYIMCILHLIKIRTFLKKIDSYLEKYIFARIYIFVLKG